MTKRTMLLATVAIRSLLTVRAFDPGKNTWKLSADGKTIEMKDGNPIWLNANGEETAHAGDTIARLNSEAKTNRERAEAAETKLAPFKDIDPVAAKKAIEDLKKIGQGQLIAAGEVDKVKAEITTQFTAQLTEAQKANQDLQQNLDGLRKSNVFANSNFIREHVALPADMFEAYFSPNLKVKEGKIEAYDKAGNRIMSKAKIGEYADPDEALSILVDAHPQKATILKAPGHSGSGNQGNGGNQGKGRIILRPDFDKMLPHEQSALAREMGEGKVTIVDPPK